MMKNVRIWSLTTYNDCSPAPEIYRISWGRGSSGRVVLGCCLHHNHTHTALVGVTANLKGCQISIALNNHCVCSGLIARGIQGHGLAQLTWFICSYFTLSLSVLFSEDIKKKKLLNKLQLNNLFTGETHCVHTHRNEKLIFISHIFVLAEILNPRIITENLRKQLSLYKYVDKNNLLHLCVICVDICGHSVYAIGVGVTLRLKRK